MALQKAYDVLEETALIVHNMSGCDHHWLPSGLGRTMLVSKLDCYESRRWLEEQTGSC